MAAKTRAAGDGAAPAVAAGAVVAEAAAAVVGGDDVVAVEFDDAVVAEINDASDVDDELWSSSGVPSAVGRRRTFDIIRLFIFFPVLVQLMYFACNISLLLQVERFVDLREASFPQ